MIATLVGWQRVQRMGLRRLGWLGSLLLCLTACLATPLTPATMPTGVAPAKLQGLPAFPSWRILCRMWLVGILLTDAFTAEANMYLDLMRFNLRSLAGVEAEP